MFTVREIIELALRIEENGEKAYRKAAQEVQDPELKAALFGLADEEAEHGRWFLRLKEHPLGERKDPRLEEMAKGVLKGVLGDQTFSLAEADFSRIETVRHLLALSIEFEKDTILFYEMLGAFIEDPGVQQVLEQIIEEESRHVQTLEERLAPKGLKGKQA